KVFASLFSKSDRPSKGAQPLVAPAGAKYFQRCFISRSEICSSLQLLAQKERRKVPQCKKRTFVGEERCWLTVGVRCEKTVSVLSLSK
ncbi:MAG: hypothetical protein II330_03135, partial [Clostridia bacterium]|nr:hypothetical protein [Clostridia bacterium]